MTDIDDKDNRGPRDWTGRRAARDYIVWLILWVLVELAIITWVFYASGEEAGAGADFPMFIGLSLPSLLPPRGPDPAGKMNPVKRLNM